MKIVGGMYLPDHEQHMVAWITANNTVIDGKLTYQYAKLNAAMEFVKNWRTAIDAGAHCGFWSVHLVKRFQEVYAFEPVAEHRACFIKNVPSVDGNSARLRLYHCALGEREGEVAMTIEQGSSGGTYIATNGHAGEHVPVCTLDSQKIANVDFLKIDVEGYELFVVRGGEQTIRRDRPCIVIEQKPKGLAERYGQTRMAAVELLQSWGAKIQFEMSGDYCLTFGG